MPKVGVVIVEAVLKVRQIQQNCFFDDGWKRNNYGFI